MYLESSRSQSLQYLVLLMKASLGDNDLKLNKFLSAVWYILLDGIDTKLLHLLILSNMLLVVFSTFLEYF